MLQDWILAIEDWVPMLAGSSWVYLALFAFAAIDGFFPPIPSETVVIALSSLAISQGVPNIALVALAGAAGAFTGDQIAYMIGSHVDVRNLRLFRTGRGRRALDWAEHALENRGSSFILAARYIPIGRVAVNMTAGALGYPRRRFVGLTALAAITWAAYGTVIGAGAGVWLADHSLLGVVVGVAVGTLVGLAIDWVLRRWTGLRETPTAVSAGPVVDPVDQAGIVEVAGVVGSAAVTDGAGRDAARDDPAGAVARTAAPGARVETTRTSPSRRS